MSPSLSFDGRDLVLKADRGVPGLKQVLGARWSPSSGGWTLPPTSLSVLKIVEWLGEDVLNGAPQEVKDLALEPWGFKGFTDEERKAAESHPQWSKLFPFQREGVEWMYCNPHGAGLCSLSWGMGKGAVACVTADLLEAKKVLVLAPLTLAPAWIGEFDRWTEGRHVKRATPGDREPGPEVTIANHELVNEVVLIDEHGDVLDVDWSRNARKVKEWRDAGPARQLPNGKIAPARQRVTRAHPSYTNADWDLIVVDESVLLKNRKAVKLKVLAEIRKASDPYVFLLSGSPITRHRDDLWSQMNTLLPRGFTSYWRFAETFCVVDKGGWGWTIEGDNPENDPHEYLKDMMWVKSQDEAMPDLPEYVVTHMPLEPLPAQRRALDSMMNEWIVELEGDPTSTVSADTWLARTTRLQQITSNMASLPGGFAPASAKEDCLLDLLGRGEIELPLLVWAWYVETAKQLEDSISSAFPSLRVKSVTGSMKSSEKDDSIAAYKEGGLDVLVLQMGVGKFGHTFTNTKTVFYHDRSFDSDAYVQSLARVRRIGLQHQPALIVPELAGSADALITANLEGKLESVAKLTNADLARLLGSLKAA